MHSEAMKHAVWIDEEGATEREALVFQKDAVAARDRLGHVSKDRVLEVGEALIGLGPAQVRVNGVGAGGDDHAVPVREVAVLVIESDKLRRADEREVHRVEHQQDPLAGVVGKGDGLELFADEGLGLKRGGWGGNLNAHARFSCGRLLVGAGWLRM